MALNITLNQTISNPITTDPAVILYNLKPLALIVVGIVIYAIFIFKFYKYLAKRDILMAGWHNKYSWKEGAAHRLFSIILYTLEYIVLVPIIIFFWFLIMAGILLFVSNNTVPEIMLISMAIIAGVRTVSYYSEDLARDLAKLMPLSLIAIFVSDLSFFSLENTLSNAGNMFLHIDKLVFYLAFVALVEFIMRIVELIREAIKRRNGMKESEIKKKGKTSGRIIDVR